MFDQKSTTKDRRDFLVQILEEERMEEEEDPIPDDETLNRMISRSEEEFELFQRMDAERISKDMMDDTIRHHSRLMQEVELPEFLLQDVHKVKLETSRMRNQSDMPLGRNQRCKGQVNYADISDSKWLKALEEGNLEELTSENKRKRLDDSPSDSSAKKICRKQKLISRTPIPIEMTREMLRIWQEVVYFQDEKRRSLSDIFMELPSRRALPHYYAIVTNPIDFLKIKDRILNHYYSENIEFQSNMRLLFSNARHYNIEESQIYEDSIVLEEVFNNIIEDLDNGRLDTDYLMPEIQAELDSIGNSKTTIREKKKKRGRPPKRAIAISQIDSDNDQDY